MSPLHSLSLYNNNFVYIKITPSPKTHYRKAIMISFFFLLSLSLLHGALGKLVCEELPVGMCSFAIASSGNRCLLETSAKAEDSNKGNLYCKTSNATPTANVIMSEYIETDSCVKACGVDRMAVGISSDNLLDSCFSRKLCSSRCLGNCPNIADLYHNLALGEGMYLPDLCTRVYGSSRRAFFVNLAGEPKPPSTESSDEMNRASEPEPPLSATTVDDDEATSDDDEDVASSVPEASPFSNDHDRVSDDDSAAPAALPEALDVAAHHHQHRLRSGFIKFKVAARPV